MTIYKLTQYDDRKDASYETLYRKYDDAERDMELKIETILQRDSGLRLERVSKHHAIIWYKTWDGREDWDVIFTIKGVDVI